MIDFTGFKKRTMRFSDERKETAELLHSVKRDMPCDMSAALTHDESSEVWCWIVDNHFHATSDFPHFVRDSFLRNTTGSGHASSSDFAEMVSILAEEGLDVHVVRAGGEWLLTTDAYAAVNYLALPDNRMVGQIASLSAVAAHVLLAVGH